MLTEALSVYHQEPAMWNNEEWDLFGGQLLLTTPDAPAAWLSEVGGAALRDETSGGQLCGQSPVDELPQGSIWLDTFDELTSESSPFSSFQKDGAHLSTGRTLARSSSSDEAFLLYEECGDNIGDLSFTYPPSYDILPPTSEDPQPVSFGMPDGLETFSFPSKISPSWDQDVNKNDESILLSPYLPERSHQSLNDLFSLQFRTTADGISQKVPCDASVELELFDSDNIFDPNDPVSVCKILRLLGDDINMAPSPMSPEEVDTVLCQEPDVGSSRPASVAASDHSSLSSLSSDFLQHKLSVKAAGAEGYAKFEPYHPVGRKQMKKEQNKNAAQRYREKKREEKGGGEDGGGRAGGEERKAEVEGRRSDERNQLSEGAFGRN